MDPVARSPLAGSEWRRGLVAGAVLAGLLLAAGCGYFKPTSPEIPTRAQLVPRYTAAETTLVTLGLAIQDKSGTNGQIAYTGCFADTSVDGVSFHAFFDPITLARFTQVPTDWDVNQEQIFYAKLSRLQPGATFQFSWGEFHGAPDDDHQPSSAILYRSYLIIAQPPDAETFVPVARGNADLHFALLRGNWKLVRWQDHEDPQANFNSGELSFGQLRLAGP